ncbi:MAG: hypothetical protein AAFY41_00190 [Bacteroidota bacterium]
MEKPEKVILGEQQFWSTWLSKLLFTLISVKVWGLVGATTISTILLLNPESIQIGENTYFGITGGQWMTFNTTIWALIFGMKEVFKISEKRDKTEKEVLDKQLESRVKVASLIEAPSSPSSIKINHDGTETVGSEPD